jgi:hypothetical protein
MRLFTRRDQRFPRDKKYYTDPMCNEKLMGLFWFYNDGPGWKNAKGEWSFPEWPPDPYDVALRSVLFFPLETVWLGSH